MIEFGAIHSTWFVMAWNHNGLPKTYGVNLIDRLKVLKQAI
ncbi:hypothetical protein LVISKB_2115 [Levilactobacillus brevis KB290]|uniref:Uncharacterized protein n=1 Tax=Levilactobacillus brevis KB290 TaxID=1001583 RepID=M5AH43_LEVBR|nr:hypothetical protein LVISKB_2115 [Levilactobacillus brevis KB290]